MCCGIMKYMLEAIALLSPALVALRFYDQLHENKLPTRILVTSYGIFVILINLSLYAATLYLANHEDIVFTDAYFIKYLICALVLSVIMPFVVNLTEATISVKVTKSNGRKK